MSSKNKENLSEADLAYKEELDSLVLELLNLELDSPESEEILLKLSDHATNDFGNLSTIPKALQFLITHKGALDEHYKRYAVNNGEDTYSLVLLLELVSFVETINMSEAPKKESTETKKEEEKEEQPKFKLLLYKLEANLVAARLLAPKPDFQSRSGNRGGAGSPVNGVGFAEKTSSYKLSENARKKLENRKVNDWGNEYLISLSSEIVTYYSLPSTRNQYSKYLEVGKGEGTKEKKSTVVMENNPNLVIEESLKLIEEMTTYWLKNGFEFDAIDLLLEVDRIESIENKCGEDYDLVTRVCNYMSSISQYGATYTETSRILSVTYNVLMKNERYIEAMRIAIKLNDQYRVLEVMRECKDHKVLKQLGLILSTNNLYISTLNVSSPTNEESKVRRNFKGVKETNMDEDVPEFEETVRFLNSGENKSALFLELCKELDVMEPKHPNEVLKGYPSKANISITQSLSGVSLDSPMENLSYTILNAFVNCGTSCEKLINPQKYQKKQNQEESKEKKDEWIFKHHQHGIMCATASLGLVHLWNIDEGLSELDKYQYSTDKYVRAGAYMGLGLVSCGVNSELDPIKGLLTDKIDLQDKIEKLGAIIGLCFGYAGTNRMDILEILIPLVIDLSVPLCSMFSSITLAIIFIGTGNQESSEAVLQALMEYITNLETSKEEKEDNVDQNQLRMYLLSLGLLQLGRGEMCEPVLEALKVLGKYEKVASTIVESFAHATSGDVLKVQGLLKNLVFHSEGGNEEEKGKNKEENMEMEVDEVEEKKEGNEGGSTSNTTGNNGNRNTGTGTSENTANLGEDKKNKGEGTKKDKMEEKEKEEKLTKEVEELLGLSILCISLISLGEKIGSGMLLRLMEHPLQYGTVQERRAVPLAIALVNISNPSPQIVSLLSKLTHDSDKEVSLHAVLALGLVGAGTNNSRVSQLLQTIAKHSNRDGTIMFVVRISVGLLFMGKGTLTLSPLHSEGFLLNKVSLAGLLVVLFCSLDLRWTVCMNYPFIIYFLALAIRPRWLMTLNNDLEVVNVPVRVGTSVDTIGTAGKQRKVSGFQTHKTPVLIGVGERAELATEEVETLSPYLEGIVLVSNTQ